MKKKWSILCMTLLCVLMAAPAALAADGEAAKIDTGDTAWVLISAALVFIMTNTEEKTATVLKIAADSLTLLRQGGVVQEQHFQPRQEHTSVYRTPYGNLDLSVKTEKIAIVFGTISGNIDVAYAMNVIAIVLSSTMCIGKNCSSLVWSLPERCRMTVWWKWWRSRIIPGSLRLSSIRSSNPVRTIRIRCSAIS